MCLAIPGVVLSIDGQDALLRNARVQFGGAVKTVSLAMAPEAEIGDYVLVHAGLAIGVVDADEAEKTLAYFRDMGGLDDEGAVP